MSTSDKNKAASADTVRTHARFDEGTYRVCGDRWFGRGRVLTREESTGFTAPILGLLPKEHADVTIHDGLLRNAQVNVDSITTPSPWRQTPPCSQAAFCPGCTLQHVNVAGRRAYHRVLIEEVLQRFGGFDDLPTIDVHMGTEGDHRTQTRLWLQRLDDPPQSADGPDSTHTASSSAWAVGMRRRRGLSTQNVGPTPVSADTSAEECAAENHEAQYVDFSQCLANAPALRVAAKRLQSLPIDRAQWRRVNAKSEWIELRWTGRALQVNAASWPVALQEVALQHLRDDPDIPTPVEMLGTDAPWQPLNPPMQRAMYDGLLQCIDVQDRRVWDLTCGDGGLTFHLADAGAEVWASDRHWAAVQRTAAGAQERGLSRVHTRGGDAAAVLKGAKKRGEHADIIVVNPMREPVGDDAMHAVHQSGATALFYFAPAPKAGAKDLNILRNKGWSMQQTAAFVLHPWTGQSMLFAWMRRPKA